MDPDPDSDPAIAATELQGANKILFKKKVFLLITVPVPYDATFQSFFKDKKSKRSRKTVGINVFLTIFA
jgi:hypothetical protein